MNTLSPHPGTVFKKGDIVNLAGIQRIIMAKLQGDGTNPISYSVCDALDLKNPQFGIQLDGAEIVPLESLSEAVRARVRNFL